MERWLGFSYSVTKQFGRTTPKLTLQPTKVGVLWNHGFEVGPPALEQLPVWAAERSPFCERMGRGKRGPCGSEDTLREERWTGCPKKSGHLTLHLSLQPHGSVQWVWLSELRIKGQCVPGSL